MELDEDLELLRHPELGVIDLTGSGVQRLKDKKAKRRLEPVLQKALPRRRKGIENSSYYRALRVKLLPYNLYFKQDVVNLRELFHVPEGQIADVNLAEFSERKEPWNKDDLLNWRQAVGCWLHIHRCVALGTPLDDSLPPLPQWLIDSATTALQFSKNAPFSWLQREPNIPAPYGMRFNLRIPMDYCVARLIERYQIPWRCGGNLQSFILTQNRKYLEYMPSFDVTMEPTQAPVGQAYKVTIDWIDEYTTKKQWDEIYEEHIQPRQNSLWEKRGELPHSRQVDLNSHTVPEFIEFYKFMAEQQMTGHKCGPDKALELMSLAKKLPASMAGIDRSVVYRHVKTLDILCKPHD